MRSPESRKQTMHRLQETRSAGLQLSSSHALLSESPERSCSGLRALTRSGLYQNRNLGWNIRASKYTHAGDSLRIDCGNKPNGVIGLFHGIRCERS